MSRTKLAVARLLTAAAIVSPCVDAYAASRSDAGPIGGWVVAYSHDGNGSIKAPWRDTPRGRQVRLPHGTWVYCRTSCSETLRVQTIDIWANVNNGTMIGAGTIQNECGVFGCLHWEWSF